MTRRPASHRGAVLTIILVAATAASGPARGEAQGGAQADTRAETRGYRTGDYRAPVPATLGGATVVATQAAEALWRSGRVLFVDVLPRPPRPEGLPAGTIWREAAHESIPGAIWLPNVGYGDLAPVWQDYMAEALSEATGGRTDHPVLFFCLAECWMSWNAAKRAREELGYADVYWYPDGIDGWAAAALPLAETPPVEPMPPTASGTTAAPDAP